MFFKNRKVLVTGGTGFVGTHFVQELLERKANVRSTIHNRQPIICTDSVEFIHADLTTLDGAVKACEGVDYVIHAAGSVGAAGVSSRNAISAVTSNLVLTVRVLEAAYLNGVKRILIFSSGASIYPEVDYPIKEDQMWNGPPAPVYFGYGWMRRYVELLGEFVAQKSDLGIAICRPTAIYGRYDNFNPGASHVIAALISRAISKEDPFVVWGNGNEVRDFLHVADLVRGCLTLLEKHAVCDPVNIGYGQGISTRDLVTLILSIVDHQPRKIEFDVSKPSTIGFRLVDTSKAQNLIGFSPGIALPDGIRDTVEWFKSYCSSSKITVAYR